MRPIDADALLQKVSRMIDYCKTDAKINALAALFQVGDAIMDCPTCTIEQPIAVHGLGDPMTNADHIRSMNDWELESAIRKIVVGCKPWCDGHCKMDGDGNCNMCLASWLKQPYEEEK